MKKNTILLILIIAFSAKAQTNNYTKSFVIFDVFSNVYDIAPRLSLGYYHRTTENSYLGIKIGAGNYTTSTQNAKVKPRLTHNYLSYEIAPEFLYMLNMEQYTKQFLSLQFAYIHHKDSFTNSLFINHIDGMYYSYDSADYTRNKLALNINYGILIPIKSRFQFIAKSGFGIKYVDTRYENIINLEQTTPFFYLSRGMYDNEGKFLRANFNLEVHLVYKLN